MIHYLFLYLIIILSLISLPKIDQPNITIISYIKSCLYIHEYNFINHLLLYANTLYSIYNGLDVLSRTVRSPKTKILIEMIKILIKENHIALLAKVIKFYKHKDMCISKHTRTVIIPIESLNSLEYIKYTNGIIRHLGDGSLANRVLLDKIVKIDFDNGTMCLDCKEGRFVVLSEHYDRQLAYYRVIGGEYKLSIICIDRRLLSKLGILSDLEPVLDYLNFCE